MPELPEVETIARHLAKGDEQTPSVIGQKIVSSSVFWAKTIAEPDISSFQSAVKNQTVLNVSRCGKFLIMELDHAFLLIHLRMSGDLMMRHADIALPLDVPLVPHDHVYFHFGNSWHLAFNDTRKFGRVWLTPDPKNVLGKLGPEPFDPKLTARVFANRLSDYKRQLKPLLLDQSFSAGLGNIYSDEALFIAGLHPKRLSNTLSFDDSNRLLRAIRKVLRLGIEHNGASIDWAYKGGGFQNYFQVYQQTGNPCPHCGKPIQRTVIGQRGTHFCERCQK